MIDHRLRRMHTKAFKEYAKEASEMSREELEHAYARVRFAHTTFETIPKSWINDIFPIVNDEDL